MKKKEKRITIAFLTRSFSVDLISYSIWSGVYGGARDADVNLICLPGNPPRSQFGFEFQANVLYDMIDPATIDGLIVWGGAMVGGSSPEDTLAFYRRFDSFPVVNISLEINDIPCLISDNYAGMLEACAHLITVHGCRRPAFIRGPENHPESRERLRAYRDALERYGIDFDPGLVVTGNFLRASGRMAVAKLCDERSLSFDGVVCANDLMALGVMDELLARGIRIPDNVKVVGFDDIDESQYFRIPLSTVRQPFYEMGKSAVDNLLRIVRREPFQKRHILPARLVARQSCGCFPVAATVDGDSSAEGAVTQRAPERDAFVRLGRPCLVAQANLSAASADRLAGLFYDEVWSRRSGAFLPALNGELLQRLSPEDIRIFHAALSALRRCALEFLRSDTERLVAGETLLHRARILVGEYLEKARAFEVFQKAALTESLNSINRTMISTYNFDDMIAIVAREFPRFGMHEYYFCMYDEPSGSLDFARLLIAFRDKKKMELPSEGVRFPAKLILPEGLWPADRRLTFIVEPLYFHGDQLGFIVFEDDHKPAELYEELRAHLCVALKGSILFREKEKLLAEREAQARSLLATSTGLARSNAELEQFSYIVSHDLKEPLRKIAVFADRLHSLPSVDGDAQAREYLDRMIGSAHRMHDLIDDLLAYSRISRRTGPFRKVDLNESIRAVLQDLEILIERENACVEVGELPVIEAEPRHIEQLLQNLITNALKFHQPERPVRITVSSRRIREGRREYCELTVRDNGIGIEPRHAEDIFGLFQRLQGRNAFEGSGIGLAICKKVAEEHNGRIRVESEKGAGAAFIVTLPLRQ
ncbi:MAG: substrate-binding domain-containing protein [Spirochaetales bacterium]|nr:substrate-binding domain-containing protein [Spirochaetales bacterium]